MPRNRKTMKEISSRSIGIDQGDDLLFSDFESGGQMWSGSGERECRATLQFSHAFLRPPSVFVTLSLWDIDKAANARVELVAEKITRRGFDAVLRTWEDTRVARARVAWMAIGPLSSEDDWDVT